MGTGGGVPPEACIVIFGLLLLKLDGLMVWVQSLMYGILRPQTLRRTEQSPITSVQPPRDLEINEYPAGLCPTKAGADVGGSPSVPLKEESE